MAAKYLRRRTWWVRFYDPRTKELVRGSLETSDSAKAELLRQRVELEAALLEPRFQAAEVPSKIRQLIGGAIEPPMPATPVVAEAVLKPPAPARARVPISDALKAYFNFIGVENSSHHVAGKLSMMRRFFGSTLVTEISGRKPARKSSPLTGAFGGGFLDEITVSVVQDFMSRLEVSRKTKRHYREFFHHFFEFCIKRELYRPTNWHSPNPIASLPSYVTRNRRIVFLSYEQVERQLRLLEPFPTLQIAVAVMIYAGLRRAETLWLTRDAISADFSYLSIINRTDDEREIESSLKTGERTVTVLPALKKMLVDYTSRHHGQWLIPAPRGGQWDGSGFAKKLRAVNRAAGLAWTCLHYRHTYATQRAADGWPLFRIAREMGNSVSVVEEYYAGFIRPDSAVAAA
jgi:integrase